MPAVPEFCNVSNCVKLTHSTLLVGYFPDFSTANNYVRMYAEDCGVTYQDVCGQFIIEPWFIEGEF
jgi:hypothetical protein